MKNETSCLEGWRDESKLFPTNAAIPSQQHQYCHCHHHTPLLPNSMCSSHHCWGWHAGKMAPTLSPSPHNPVHIAKLHWHAILSPIARPCRSPIGHHVIPVIIPPQHAIMNAITFFHKWMHFLSLITVTSSLPSTHSCQTPLTAPQDQRLGDDRWLSQLCQSASLVCLTPRRDYHPLAVTDIA